MRIIIFFFTILLFIGCSGDQNNSKLVDSTEATESIETTKGDKIAPSIKLKGEIEIVLDITQEYVEYGAVAYDNVDGNISFKIDVFNNINVGVEGNYTVTYRVSDSSGNVAVAYRYVIVKDRLKELSTDTYKTKWFNRAKKIWNEQNPNNQYEYNYYTYEFPANADRVAGTPADNPISPKEWIQTAGLGFSKFLKYPFEDSKYQYTDELVKEWKSKGFKNGRLHVPLYDMVDLEKDPSGATLKVSDLAKIKEICDLFVKNGIPITISANSGDELSDNMKDDREGTFYRVISWWRQLASYLKDESYLVAFENFVEYHGFDDVDIEKKDFKVYVDNNETHYQGVKNYKNLEITNWVRTPGYNNLLAEIAKVIRITNPKRIVLYKPHGIGRAGLVNITPWRWGSESDYLAINNQKTPYWLLSSGGSANLKLDYIKAIRSSDNSLKDELLASARVGSWGPAVDYFNDTKTPVWIALFGIKVDLKKVDSELDGVDVTTDEIVSYINWYQNHIQNDVKDENGDTIKVSSGFQQGSWVWDFTTQSWFEGTLNDRWESFEKVRDALSVWANEFK